MPKEKQPSKADLAKEIEELKAQLADKEPAVAPVEQGEMVTVECICSNVHLGNGVILRARRDTPQSNWEDGDTAEISKGLADLLVKKKQVRIL